jgi:hypothetical protein
MAGEIIDDPGDSSGASDHQIEMGDELPVKIDTLSLDGTQPEVGDDVEVKVKGKVSRIRDDCAYVTLETANDEPIENPAKQPEDDQGMMDMAQKADMGGVPVGGGY